MLKKVNFYLKFEFCPSISLSSLKKSGRAGIGENRLYITTSVAYFFLKLLLHFNKFLVNANFDLVTKYILKTEFNNDSVDLLSVLKYCKVLSGHAF